MSHYAMHSLEVVAYPEGRWDTPKVDAPLT
jgi:hypothetical protein